MTCIFLINNVKTRFTELGAQLSKSAWNVNLGIHNTCTSTLSVFCIECFGYWGRSTPE